MIDRRVLALLASVPLAAACSSAPDPRSDAFAVEATAAPAAEGPAPEEAAPPPAFDCQPVRDDTEAGEGYPVPPPPFSKGVFPCSRCHDKPDDFNMTPRNLTLEHTTIKLVHGPRAQWCYDCHNPSNRDTLRLAGGRAIPFERSYELCGQCHGEKLRDWRLGIHGRRIGCWNGARQYRLCVHCHYPHQPRFHSLAPKPRPKRPDEIRLPGEGG